MEPVEWQSRQGRTGRIGGGGGALNVLQSIIMVNDHGGAIVAVI